MACNGLCCVFASLQSNAAGRNGKLPRFGRGKGATVLEELKNLNGGSLTDLSRV